MIEQSTEIVLSAEERETLEKAFWKILNITKELWDNDVLANEEGVFYCLYENYKKNEHKLSKYISYEE